MTTIRTDESKWNNDGTNLIPKDSLVNVNISKADPEIRLTDTGDSEYARITRTDTLKKATRYNRVLQGGGAGSALDFIPGSSQYISVPHTASLNITSNMTILAWVNTDILTGFPMVVCKGLVNTAYQLHLNSGKPEFRLYVGAVNKNIIATNQLATDTWYHIAGVYDGTFLKIYVNGVNAGTDVNIGAVTTDSNENALNIGSTGNPSLFWDGQLDEVRIYDRDLSAAEILADYAAGEGTFGVDEANLAGGWHLDENTGTSAADFSSNGNTGTLQNTPAWVTGHVATSASTAEATIWNSQDGTGASEKGIQTFGDSTGRTVIDGNRVVIDGKTMLFNVNGVEKARFTTNGILGIGTSTPAPTDDGSSQIAGGLSVGNSVSANVAGTILSKQSTLNRGIYYFNTTGDSYIIGGSSVGEIQLVPNGTAQFYVTNGGNVITGNKAALATTATNGFLYIPSCAGTPTGVPTSYTGKVPMVYDSTNNVLYIYSNGAWRTH